MKVRVRRSDDITGMEFAVFETDAPPRKGDRIRFTDDGEAFFEVISVIYDLERFGPGVQPNVVAVVTSDLLDAAQFDLAVVWQDEAERPPWLPEEFIIMCNYLPRAGEIITIGLVDLDTTPKMHEDMPAVQFVDVEVVAVAHGTLYQPLDADRDVGIGFGDWQTEIRVRKVERGEGGDLRRTIARARRN